MLWKWVFKIYLLSFKKKLKRFKGKIEQMIIKVRKKTALVISSILVIVIIAVVLFFLFYKPTSIYQFKDDTFYYSQNRGVPDYILSLNRTENSFEVYNVNFKSRNFMNYETRIYGLLFKPKSNFSSSVPGLVLLPGGAVTKESESIFAEKIAKLGYAVLTIDQRGVGQTGGYYLWLDQDYEVFINGNEPVQQLSVYDGLVATDVLGIVSGIDKNNIAIAGESMGGRYAIIAAAQDKRLRGALIISSSGFNFKKTGHPYDSYLISVDPDHYIDKISPNKLFMLHGSNDSIINLSEAQRTFGLAKEPKRFFIADDCSHGYCDKMYNELVTDLKMLFSD
jgi:hypothetical protein